MTEKQLQSEIVKWFSQNHPELRGCLFSVANRTLSLRDGQTQLAMGLFSGVSDLILFVNGRFIGLEVKEVGKAHKRSHIENQIEWGETVIRNGGEYYFITSVSEFNQVLNNEIPRYTIAETKKLLNKNVVVF